MTALQLGSRNVMMMTDVSSTPNVRKKKPTCLLLTWVYYRMSLVVEWTLVVVKRRVGRRQGKGGDAKCVMYPLLAGGIT